MYERQAPAFVRQRTVDAQRQVTFNGRTVEVERHAHCFLCPSVLHLWYRRTTTPYLSLP
jgi:hypothetical protein